MLPLGYTKRRERIIFIDRVELRRFARKLRGERGKRYELIGYAGPDEVRDPDLARTIGARRASKAIYVFRSLGLSSKLFEARGGNPEKLPELPATRGRRTCYGAVVIREIEDEGR